jgi:uncharacterized protein (DUF305 family)
MNKRKLTLTTLILSALISFCAAAADKEKSSMTGDEMKTTPMADMLKSKSGDEFEAHYLGTMVMHHKDGVKMANMALEKANSSQLKQMMQKTASEQQQEIDKMTGWLKQWHNKSPNDFSMPPESEQMMQKSMSELQRLSGAEFDKTFAKHMVHHHNDAIAMSKMASSKAKHDEVKKLASNIVSSQTEENQKLMKMAKM